MDAFYTPRSCEGCPATIVCHCLNVTEAEVVQVINRLELRTIKEVQRHVGAGAGCTCCHPQIAAYLEKFSCVTAVAS